MFRLNQKYSIYISILVLLLVLPAAQLEAKPSIRVAVATNMSYVIKHLEQLIEQALPEVDVSIVLASSGKLTAQIVHGAPFDVFLSADMKYPEHLYQQGLTQTKPRVYAKGKLIFFSRQDLSRYTKQFLLHDDFKKVACANVKTAPYGRAAQQYIQAVYADQAAVKTKLVYAESVSQALHYAISLTDGGFVAKAAIYSPKLSQWNIKDKHWRDLEQKYYAPIEQGIVLWVSLNKSRFLRIANDNHSEQ